MSIQPRGGRFKGDYFLIPVLFEAMTNITRQFAPLFGRTFSATEADVDVTNDIPFLIRRLRVITVSNSVTGDTVVEFRVNGATAISRTIATTVVGESASGVVSLNVASGDMINWALTVTDGAANTVTGAAYLICQRVTE